MGYRLLIHLSPGAMLALENNLRHISMPNRKTRVVGEERLVRQPLVGNRGSITTSKSLTSPSFVDTLCCSQSIGVTDTLVPTDLPFPLG